MGRLSWFGRLSEILRLEFERLLGVDGRHRRRPVYGCGIDIGQRVEGGRRGWIDHGSDGP